MERELNRPASKTAKERELRRFNQWKERHKHAELQPWEGDVWMGINDR